MNQLDTYYRALLTYRSLTSKTRECAHLNRAIAQANTESDRITIQRYICHVEEDWICEIEKGLVFIEKAIKEERQFIYSQGEVVPIEKVKHVSRDSVQHLAKHSELISRMEKGEDIIPDKLYSVERLNDYAVYENRFLYMLLCYLRDFVTIRYDKILEHSNRYDGTLELNKEIVTPKETITYSVNLRDLRKNDKYLREHNPSKDVIDRIDLILKTILAFLATPLMECAGKVAMLKPPITKTNVLKMDNNFKGAVALYDYIIAYDKDGYTLENSTKELAPFENHLADELADACSIMTFLVYEYGLDLNDELKRNYVLAEQERRAEELRQKNEQLAALKRRLANSDIPVEEYVLALEKQVKLLQSEAARIEPMLYEINLLRENEERLQEEIEALKNRTKELEDEILARENEHLRIVEEIKEKHRARIAELMEQHESELHELEKEYEARVAAMSSELSSVKDQWRREVSDLRGEWRREVDDLRQELKQEEERYLALTEEHEALAEEKLMCEARIKALRLEKGRLPETEDFTDKSAFDALEKEFEAFHRFYQKQWSKTKKKIRKDILNYENLKGQNGQNHQP